MPCRIIIGDLYVLSYNIGDLCVLSYNMNNIIVNRSIMYVIASY